MHEQNVTAYISRGTNQDLSDAMQLMERVLPNSEIELDSATLKFSRDLFVAVSMEIAYSDKQNQFDDMLEYLVDSGWEHEMQIICSFQDSRAFLQVESRKWLQSFNENYLSAGWSASELLIKQSYLHWTSALVRAGLSNKKQALNACVQIFSQKLVSEALGLTTGLKDEKTNWSNQLLQDAQRNLGFRAVPDAKKAGVELQAINLFFENLAGPISRLRTSLVLANCMKPEDFHIRPILLLGEPGIGKTFLASQLGKVLGVPMEKISAGGAQGGFQITGSHSSWTDARPGAIFTALAKGESAAPVVLVDEVDKIHDTKYPVLPVLLDLLEIETSRHFKDEYFEMQIDASKVIFILTANSIENVPDSLLSRCEVFNIPRPGMQQRMRIIEGLIAKLCVKTNIQIQLNRATAVKLAERTDLDLRKVTFVVEDAFARAIQAGDTVAYVWQLDNQDIAESMNKQEAGRLLH